MSTKDCGHSTPCGCEDQPLMGPPPCAQGTPNCPDPDPCPETFRAACLVWTNDDLVCDTTVLATNGDRLPLILERIVALFCNQAEIAVAEVICGETTVIPEGSTLDEAFAAVVNYFCQRLGELESTVGQNTTALLNTTQVATLCVPSAQAGCTECTTTITFRDNGNNVIDTVDFNYTQCTPTTYGLFAQTADSTPVVDPVAGSLIGAGVGSLTVPEGQFQVGDSFRLKMAGKITCSNIQELSILVRVNAVSIAGTGLIDLQTATASEWLLEVDFTIRSLGGTAQVVSAGTWSYIVDSGGQNLEGSNFSTVSTIDTTIANILDVVASFNLDQGGANVIFSELFTLSKTY